MNSSDRIKAVKLSPSKPLNCLLRCFCCAMHKSIKFHKKIECAKSFHKTINLTTKRILNTNTQYKACYENVLNGNLNNKQRTSIHAYVCDSNCIQSLLMLGTKHCKFSYIRDSLKSDCNQNGRRIIK